MADRIRCCTVPALVALAVLCAVPSIEAGGFAVPDSDVVSAGVGGASVAHPTGAASQFKNVAGLAFLDRPELSVGGIGRVSMTDFAGASPYPGDGTQESETRTPRVIPVFAYAQPLSAHLVVGLGVDVPFDLQTAWTTPDAFSGRFLAQDASLRCYSITPSLAWKLADRLAIGGGLDVNVATLDMQRNLPAINPFTMRVVDGATLQLKSDSVVALGYRVGVLARPSEAFAVGLAYRHSASLSLTGIGLVDRIPTGATQLDNKLAATYPLGNASFSQDVALPDRLTGGVAYSWNNWVLAAEVALERWSSFGSLEIGFADQPDLATSLTISEPSAPGTPSLTSYQDTYLFRVGIERRLNHVATVRLGYSYDPTPAPVRSLSPAFFDATRHGLAVGASFTSATWRIDLASGVRLSQERSTEGTNREGFDGTYKSAVPFFGMALTRAF
jgi:long-chain fatty acid transport protein